MPAVWFLLAALLLEPAIRWAEPTPSTGLTLRLLQLAIAVIVIASWLIQRDRRSVAARCLLSLAVLLAAISCAEWILAFLDLPRFAVSGWKSDCPETDRNELGYRGQSLLAEDDEIVVVLLGDSQVEAIACDTTAMPEQVLEAALCEFVGSTRVVSLGASGYGQDQQLLALQEYFQAGYRADLVILWQTLENDIWNNTFPTHWPTNANPKPTYVWKKGSLTYHPRPSAFQTETSPYYLGRLVRNLIPQRIDDAWETRFLPDAYEPLLDPSLPKRDAWQSIFEARISQGENLENDKHHLSLYLVPSSPRIRYGIDLTRELYRRIASEAKTFGSDFVLFNAERQAETLFEEFDDVYYNNDSGTYHFSKSQRADIADQLNVGFESFVIDVETNPYWVSKQDTHLNPTAVTEVMRKLARRLVDRKTIQPELSSGQPNQLSAQP